MLDGYNISKLVFFVNTTVVFTYSNVSNSYVLQYHGPIP